MDSNGAFVGDYEVFLSFRGKDTRRGFTDVLYEYMTSADIRVFRDDDELTVGDRIDSILEAIGSSKICIIIFSPNFAESKWCLREVTHMVELKKTIVPVFYDVSPDDVKLKETSVYTDDFKKLQQNAHGDPVEIDNWKNALRGAASIKGREIGNKSYTQFCKELVNEILSKLGPRVRFEVDHFVGDTNKAEVLKLLDIGSTRKKVVYLGIHGMGGIGKTTLTKLIYNEFLSNFDYYGFVPDIREFSANKGVDGLPTYLYDNLKPKSFIPFSRSEQIPNIFKNKKVLLILDDVDCHEQIKKIAREPSWFGSGSRIILTSRDKKVFKDFEAESSRCDIQYLEMQELGHGWSLELFSRCVFGNSAPSSSYEDLSKRAVAYAGGLPLAITVIAKYLRNQNKAVWEDIIERLKKTPPKEVKARLMISYDSLEDEQKKIFLDIVCAFNHPFYLKSSHVLSMWQAYELYPHWSLEVLQSRSLVKVLKNAYYYDEFHFKIHDQLRDLGRYIVITESGGDLRKQSILWKENEVFEVLKCKEKNMIEALNLNNVGSNFTDEDFVSFDKLRYLYLHCGIRGSKLSGDFSNLFPNLAWLRYSGDMNEVRNLAPSNLVILDLSKSSVDEKWDGWSQILMLKKLKVLDLSGCRMLRTPPIFPQNMDLESLNLSYCVSLECIDPSISKLQHLTQLNLRACNKLKNLPDSISGLMSLKVLDLSHCRMIRRIPFSESIHLEILNLEGCDSLEFIDPPIGKLQHLTQLNLTFTNLKNLPDSIGGLISNKLKVLDLSGSRELRITPVFPENMPLERLNLYSCNKLKYIDSSIGNLQHLTELNLNGCKKLKNLPDSIGGLEKLELLNLKETSFLVQLPESLGNLHSLRELDLRKSGLISLPISITRLDQLKKLDLSYCVHIQELPKLPSSLKLLRIGCGGLKNNNVPDLSNLQHLTLLWIGGARFNLLGSDGSSSSELQQDLNMGLLSMSRSLLHLTLIDCESITDVPGIGEMQGLTSLAIDGCPSLVSLVNLDKLKQLRTLWLSQCPSLVGIPGVGKLRSLTQLTVEKCDSLELIDDITGLEELQVVTLSNCKKLSKVPGLLNLKSLSSLNVRGCNSREILEVASQLKELDRGVEVDIDYSSEDMTTSDSEDLSVDDEVEANNCDNNDMQRTIELENLPGDNVEARSDDMQRHYNLGVGLATHQSELEDLPPGNRKRNRSDSPEQGSTLQERLEITTLDNGLIVVRPVKIKPINR